MNKKRVVLILTGILFAIFLAYLVSAQSPVEDLKSLFKGTAEVLTGLGETLLGPGEDASYVFARVLFLLIVFAIAWAVLSRIPMFESSTWIVFILSGAVALLSTRFLIEAAWVKTILLPYSVLGIAITAFLPLLIYFFFVEGITSRTLRKVAWILAAVVFIGLWWTRYSEIKTSALYVYPVSAVACLIFLALDGTIQRAWKRVKAENVLSTTQYQLYGQYMQQIEDLMRTQSKLPGGPNTKEFKAVQTRIEALQKKAQQILP